MTITEPTDGGNDQPVRRSSGVFESSSLVRRKALLSSGEDTA